VERIPPTDSYWHFFPVQLHLHKGPALSIHQRNGLRLKTAPVRKLVEFVGFPHRFDLVLVGTAHWSSDVDLAARNPIHDPDLMYVFHFYAGSYGQERRDRITKVLKTLHQGGIIGSHRGVGGGYSFSGDAESVTLGSLLDVLEGPWDLVECETVNEHGEALCSIRVACPSRTFMFGINRAVKMAFDQVTLGDLARGVMPQPFIGKQALGMTT